MNHYADSSFLVSCYVTDANTPQAKAWLLRTGDPLVFSPLRALEVKNALKLGVFRGLFTAANATAAWEDVETDWRSGRLVKKPVGRRFSERYSATSGLAVSTFFMCLRRKRLRAVEFVSFDRRQRTLAAAVGLKVAP